MKRATKTFLSVIVLTLTMLQPRTASAQKIDTLEVSTLYTTYIRFPMELLTAERSDSENIIGEIVQESKNIVRLRATKPFTRTSNLTVIDSKGYLHTCYIKYREHPATTYYDKSGAAPATDEQPVSVGAPKITTPGSEPSNSNKVVQLRRDDAPQLKEIIDYPQKVFHLSTRNSRITFSCINIFTYSDMLYIVFEVKNNSGVSFESDGMTFTLATMSKKSKVPLKTTNLYPKGRYGTLSIAPKQKGYIAYSLEKQTLTPEQILQISVSERVGNRELMMTLNPDDINLASTSIELLPK